MLERLERLSLLGAYNHIRFIAAMSACQGLLLHLDNMPGRFFLVYPLAAYQHFGFVAALLTCTDSCLFSHFNSPQDKEHNCRSISSSDLAIQSLFPGALQHTMLCRSTRKKVSTLKNQRNRTSRRKSRPSSPRKPNSANDCAGG